MRESTQSKVPVVSFTPQLPQVPAMLIWSMGAPQLGQTRSTRGAPWPSLPRRKVQYSV